MAARAASVQLVRVRGLPILRQLQLEEALLRADARSWCLINDGAASPAVVMGISGKPAQLLELPAVMQDGCQVIRRFSGGGTVVVDEGTIFVTLICSASDIPHVALYPRPIMQWTEQFYVPAFKNVPGFQLRENDYVLGEKKFGGNAQSITKNRWLHHTSFLWDYDDRRMSYLKIPQKAPQYRQGRGHDAFVSRMKDHVASRTGFIESVENALSMWFHVEPSSLSVAESVALREHPRSTKVVGLEELQKLNDLTRDP